MSKILGLDLGTNSIGWAVIENRNGESRFFEHVNTPTKGVIIFPEGVNIDLKTGSIKSRAAERTGYRGARRIKFRRKLRKYETLMVLAENQMCPLTVEEVKAWRVSGFKTYPYKAEFLNWLSTDNFGVKDSEEHKVIRRQQNDNPYFFRDKFSRQKYDWENNKDEAYQLGRAFYHLAQRRGFKSNRLEQSDENKISDVKELIQDSLNEVKNSAEFYEIIQKMLLEYDLVNKTKDDLDATQQKIRTILNYIKKVFSNKVKNVDYSHFEDAKSEINRYINKPERLGVVKGGIHELSEKIENEGCQTLGQYFWHLYQKDRNNSKNKIRANYTAREEHYGHEFRALCEIQQLPVELSTGLYKAIFFQRPLKSQKGLVGTCTFEKNKPRCPVSRPEFEEFRMYSFINSIKIKNPVDETLRPLSKEERDKVIPRFYLQRGSFKMEEIADALFSKENKPVYYREREAKYAPYVINYKLNTTVSGCPVSAGFKNTIGDDWQTKVFTYQTTDRKGKTVQRTADYTDLWHVLFSFDDSKKLEEYTTKKLGMDRATAKKIAKIPFQQGYSNLSLKAINKILPWLKQGLIYPHAAFMANLEKVVDKELWQNPDERSFIETSIGRIIDTHSDEFKKVNAVNALIKAHKREGVMYSHEAERRFKSELEDKLKELYGPKKWNQKEDQVQVLEHSFALLTKQFDKIRSKDAYAKIDRIDDRVLKFLRGENEDGTIFCSDESKFKYLYHPSDLETYKPQQAKDADGNPIFVDGKELEILPLPKTDAIKNPVLIRAMHQLRKLINELLLEGVIDDQTRIHIELAREVNDANKRKAWKYWQDELRDNREKAVQEIKELYEEACGKNIEPTEDDVLRYLLWNEQNRREVYEDECTNISICDIVGPDPKYDIEHTIPRSRSWDNSMMNKTLCSKVFNRDEKGNKTPFELGEEKHEEILLRIHHWKEEYEKLDNEIKGMKPSAIQDPDKRNAKIVDKHVKTFKRDYLKGKYERFIMDEVPEGFKNSQITDTGLITRFARNYLSCLFRTPSGNSNVRVVKGIAVDQFKRAWGLQKEYEKKSRINHIHHCIDAVTIACMTKDKYDAFAETWRKAEEKAGYDPHHELGKYKPWETFTQDVLNLKNEVLIVHTHRDTLPKQAKKKVRKRGSIQYKDNAKTQPIYQQGDTVRGSLHKETFYGAIARDKNGNVNRDAEGNIIPNYVVRKELTKLKSTDVRHIVDKKIREIIEQAVKDKLLTFSGIGAKMNGIIWQNEAKQIPIRKVRVYTPSVKSPIKGFKKHAKPFLSQDSYKQQFNVVNNENYCMAIYEGRNKKGKIKRSYIPINNLSAAEYYRLSNKSHRLSHRIVPDPDDILGLPLKYILHKEKLVLFYLENPKELWNLPPHELHLRLYKLVKFDAQGRLTFRPHSEARAASELKEAYTFDPTKPVEQLRVTVNNFNAFVADIDFKITTTGKILPI